MKQRIVTGLVGLLVFVVFTMLFNTMITEILMGAIILLSQTELSAATRKNMIALDTLDILFKLYIIFLMYATATGNVSLFFIVNVLSISIVFLYSLFARNSSTLSEIFYNLTLCSIVCVCLSLFLYIKFTSGPHIALFYMMIAAGSAWWADCGAYFTGTFFGKHKLIPHVSQKKTIEGLVGGIITAILGNLLFITIYWLGVNNSIFFTNDTQKVTVNFVYVCMLTPLLSLIGAFGDLCASQVKRQAGIKDFGTIMPGHGGILDRFDSLLAVAPAVFLLYKYFPLVHKV